jgi:hypothetical protein
MNIKIKYLFIISLMFCFSIFINNIKAVTLYDKNNTSKPDFEIVVPDEATYYQVEYKTNSDGSRTYYIFYYTEPVLKFCFDYTYNPAGFTYRFYYPDGTNKDTTIKYKRISFNKTTNQYETAQNLAWDYRPVWFFPSYQNTCLYTNFDIYHDNTFTNVEWSANNIQDDSISNPNSRIQITYNYNEDFSNCNINATLKNGAFSDKLFYSSSMPGFNGQFVTKKAFPIDGLVLTENQPVFIQAQDYNRQYFR